MELMEPDGSLGGFAESGKFEIPDIAYQQHSRVNHTIGFSGGDEYPLPPTLIVLKASAKQRRRLSRNKVIPNIPFHFRVLAGALALKAASERSFFARQLDGALIA
jgi:hypothetical protein